MVAVAFDTHKYIKSLQEAGVPMQQAEAQAQVLAEAIDINLATKQDLRFLEDKLCQDIVTIKHDIVNVERDIANIKHDIAILKEDVVSLKGDVASLKDDVASLKDDMVSIKNDIMSVKGDIATVKYEIIKWVVGLFVTQLGLTSGIIFGIIKLIH